MTQTIYQAVIEDVQAINALLNIEKAANKMEKSADASLQQLGKRMKLTAAEGQAVAAMLEKVGQSAVRAFENGEISAKEFNTAMGRISTSLSTMNRELGQATPQASGQAHVSIWKLATALHQMRVRGAGGGVRIVDALKGVPAPAVAAGVAVAAIAVSAIAVGKAFIEMGKIAAQVFLDITKDSVQVARQFEVTEAQFTQVFKGKEDLAKFVLGRIEDMSADFGVNLTEKFARIFLPEVGSIEEFERLARMASTLQASLGKVGDEATQALQQAQAGHFRSLVEVFGITTQDVELIKQYQEQLGPMEGLLVGLEDVFARTGRSWDTFGNTLDRVIRSAAIQVEQLKKIYGEPIAAELEENLAKIVEFFQENRDQILRIVGDIGTSIASGIDVITDAVSGITLDPDALNELLDQIDRTSTAIGVLFATIAGTDPGNTFLTVLEDSAYLLQSMADSAWLMVVALKMAVAETKNLAAGGALPVGQAGAQALQEALLDRAGAELALQQRAQDRRQPTSPSEDLEEEADDALAASAALQEYQRRLTEATDARKKWGEVMAEFDADQAARFADILLERDRKALDLLIENAERSQDILLEDTRKREDIWTEYYDAVEDAGTDFARDQQDALIKFNRAGIDAEREYTRAVEEIERKHLEKLKDIRARFDFDAQEAIRNNDAVALLRIRRRMQFELSQAQEGHGRQLDEAARNAEERRERIRIQLEREIQDASTALQRKLADEELARERSLEAQNVAYAREQENLVTWEARKRAELRRSYDQQIEDYNTSWVRRLETLRRQYAEELMIIAEFERDRNRLMSQAGLSPTGRITSPGGGLAGGAGGNRPGPGGIGGRRNSPGLVTPGVTYQVNESRGEFFTPTQNGLVAPLERLIMASRRSFIAGGPTDNSRNLHASVNIGNGFSDFTPMQLTIIQAMITNSLMGVF